MKTFAVSFVASVAALAGSALANQHPYTVPASFPAGPTVEHDASMTTQFAENAVITPLATPVFQAKLDGIYMNGAPFTFKGANYFGMETDILVPHGLWGGPQSTTIQKVATFLKSNNFNSVRLPFAVDAVLGNLPVDKTKIPNEVALLNAFNGKALSFLGVMDYTIKVFADNKIVVLLDAHVINHMSGGITDLWYTSDSDKNNFENAWKILAARYKDTWNVIDADLKNEPHGSASWGSNNDIGADNILSAHVRFITYYVIANGKTTETPKANWKGLDPVNSITDKLCNQAKSRFGDTNDHAAKGALTAMGNALRKGVVLTMSLWTDHAANCLWLDSNYPLTKDASLPGVARGSCPTTSGKPSDVENSAGSATVKYSNIRVGDIGSTTK